MRFILTLAFLVLVVMTNQTIVNGPHDRRIQLAKPQNTLQHRKLSFATGFQERELGITIPKKMCAPAASAGAFILKQIVQCAVKMLIPGSNAIGRAAKLGKTALKIGKATVKAGKMTAKKLGLFEMLENKFDELAGKVVGLLL